MTEYDIQGPARVCAATGNELKPGDKFRGFHICIVAKDKAEADRAFAALSAGGKVDMPIGTAPWGAYFGMCVDRFGTPWMVSADPVEAES